MEDSALWHKILPEQRGLCSSYGIVRSGGRLKINGHGKSGLTKGATPTEGSNVHIDTFTGGLFETNCFYLPEARLLIDAPQDAADWLQRRGYSVDGLILTHGHIDHVWDAAQIQREHSCAVYYHPETEPMVRDAQFFKRLGFNWEVSPIEPGITLGESPSEILGGIDFQLFYVPGHCPGSLCFLHKTEEILFGGDVLFAGGVGRWDLPGGDRDLLLGGIRKKLFVLPDSVRVLPGHGPATTIGVERKTNPYLQE
jgi:hydroxyacylglutathione hydrolase